MAQADPNAPQPAPSGASAPPMTAPAQAGAAAAGAAAPLTPFDFSQVDLTPNRPIDPRFGGAPDPNASPYMQMVKGMYQGNVAHDAYAPLATGPNIFDRAIDFFSTPKPGQPNQDDRAAAAQFYQRPEVQNAVLGNKDLFDRAQADPHGTMAQLAPLLAAAQNAPITSVGGRQVQDPSGLAAKVQASGLPAEAVHPFHEPHQYTEEEFVNATHGLTWNHVNQLLGMQHYQTPQQQAFGVLQQNYAKVADQAAAAYTDAVKRGLPPGKINDLKIAAEAANKQVVDLLRAQAVPSQIYPLQQMTQ